MPIILQYICDLCGTEFEQLFSEKERMPFCPICGTYVHVRRKYYAPNVHYKGNGFTKKVLTPNEKTE